MTKIPIRLDDPETRATWESAQRAAVDVAAWPAWKRGETVEPKNTAIVGHVTLSQTIGGTTQVGAYPTTQVGAYPTPAQRPSIGRIVVYRPRENGPDGDPIPAVIVRVWSDTCVNLRLFRDSAPGPDDHRRSVVLANDPDQVDAWSWPARV